MARLESQKLLSATGVTASYQGKRVLSGIDIDLANGELVAIIGHNGAGKSTLLKAIFGLVAMSGGTVALDGEVCQPNPSAMLVAGVAYVPQGNRVFSQLTVRENLRVAWISISTNRSFHECMHEVMEVFPLLRDRGDQVAGTLSGGEQQLLAIGRALMLGPRLLLLDEPSLGLAPPMVAKVLDLVQELARGRSMGVIIVEQKVREVLRVANRVYVLRRGEVAFAGDAGKLRADGELLRATYLQ